MKLNLLQNGPPARVLENLRAETRLKLNLLPIKGNNVLENLRAETRLKLNRDDWELYFQVLENLRAETRLKLGLYLDKITCVVLENLRAETRLKRNFLIPSKDLAFWKTYVQRHA